MKQRNILSRMTPKRLALSTAALCAGCCAIPVVGLALGFTAVAGLGIYFERAAVGFLVAGVLLFTYMQIKQRNAACAVDCSCKDSGKAQQH